MDLRRALFCCCGVIASGSLLLIFIASSDKSTKLNMEDNLIQSGLIMVTYMGVLVAFDVAYLITSDLFPTILLATAYGICNISARFITIFSPIVARLPHPVPLIVLIIFAFFWIEIK